MNEDNLASLVYTPETGTKELDVISPYLYVENKMKSDPELLSNVLPAFLYANKPTRPLGSALIKDKVTGAVSNALGLDPVQALSANLADDSLYKVLSKGISKAATKAAVYAPKVGKVLNTIADIAATDATPYTTLLLTAPELWNYYHYMLYGDTVAAQKAYADGILDLPRVVVENTIMKPREENENKLFGDLGKANATRAEVAAINKGMEAATQHAIDNKEPYSMINGMLKIDETGEEIRQHYNRHMKE